MLEQIGSFLYGITIGSMPYNIGIWTIVILGGTLMLDKAFGEYNVVLNRINNHMHGRLMRTKK